MFVEYNPNPIGARVGDCTIRAISKALNIPWTSAYIELVIEGYMLCDMPSANHVVGSLLESNDFQKEIVKENELYTIKDFCNDNPKGTFVVFVDGSHVLCVQDGNYYDSWDSGNEIPLYYWKRG